MRNGRERSLPAGSRIGRDLTVLGVIDSHGHAPVYIVWGHRDWCPMACKLFASARRAEEEADIISALRHPNIVRCLGVGRRPAHLLMEFIEGPTVKAMIKGSQRSRLTVSDALRVAIYIGSALAHMHQRGILHLDIKPSNVIVACGRPVLFDFGTARKRIDWNTPCIEGTDPYMAPEQCLRGEGVTPATDVFGLGVTLYQMLTGALPFSCGTARRPFPQITAEPTPARLRRPAIPAALDDLLLQCLARDPARRPASPAEILPLLHKFIRSGPRMWPDGFEPGKRPPNVRDRMPASVGTIATRLNPRAGISPAGPAREPPALHASD